MKKIIYIFVFLFCNGLHGQPFICNGDLFLCLANSGPSEVYKISIETDNQVVFTSLPAGSTGLGLNAIGYRITDNYIYGISNDQLVRIDSNGIATIISPLPGLNEDLGHWAGDISSDGQYLYVLSTGGDFNVTKELARIDLTDYSVDAFEIPNAEDAAIFCADISIDPTDGSIYGFDWNEKRLVKFDPMISEFDETLFPSTTSAVSMGAIFFDAFGNLYGYGEDQTPGIANTLFKIDKTTGIIEAIAIGPAALGIDGCGCPYTVKIQKSVFPTVSVPCETVTYTFKIVNASEEAQTNIQFLDVMPDDLIISEIVANPFGGTIVSGIGTNTLSIENLTIPQGLDSIIVRAEVAADAIGIYKNQASLSNLPPGLGSATFSDDPTTVTVNDSTILTIVPLAMMVENESPQICEGDTLILNITPLEGVTYLWDDGSTSTSRIVTEEGWYSVQLSSLCDTIIDSIFVPTYTLLLELAPDLEIQLGDSVLINSFYSGSPSFQWSDPLGNSLSCLECPDPIARPFFDVGYTLFATEIGCEATANIFIRVLKDQTFYIPNSFSPNGDGINDHFYIDGKNHHWIKSFQVYNRWGALVHQSGGSFVGDGTLGWNGMFKGKQVENGVYVYMAEIILLDGETIQVSGDVTVIR